MNRQQLNWNRLLIGALLAVMVMIAGAAPVLSWPERPFSTGGHGIASTVPTNNQVRYTITDLGSLADDASAWASDLNDLGQVVGVSNGGAFLWLPEPAYGLPAGMNQIGPATFAGALAINNSGQVAGEYASPTPHWQGSRRAFHWQNGVTTDLGYLFNEEEDFEVGGINDSGEIVGAYRIPFEYTHPFLWLPNDAYGLPAGLNSLHYDLYGDDEWAYHLVFGFRTIDINDAGQVAGAFNSLDDEWSTGYLWQNGIVTVLGQAWDSARAVNNKGQVVGSIAGQGGVLWSGGTGINLGTLNGHILGGRDVNDLGQVVGRYGSPPRAFIWQDTNGNGQSDPGEAQDLNDLIPPDSGWVLWEAGAINNQGQIAGYGTFGTGPELRAYLLTPVQTKWTFLFYWAGDNNLDASYVPIFNQLEAAANNPHVNLVVAWDRWNAPSHYYHVQHDTDLDNLANYVEGETIWSKGELDMSNPDTLSEFVLWAVENFPAEHYALLPSNHGSGLGGGLCEGWRCEVSIMSLAQMQTALSDIFWEMEQPLDVLYMDMCLMGMIEDAYQFRGLADYYVASEHLQWDFRQPYFQYVAGITAESTPAEVAVLFADSYAAEGAARLAAGRNTPYTISAADMNHLDDLVAATNNLATALNSQMDVISGTLTSVATAVQRYDNQRPKGIDLQDTYVDLYDFAHLVTQMLSGHPEIVAVAEEIKTAVNQYVIANHRGSSASVNVDNSHGVSIFFPATASSFYNPANYDFAVGANWGEPAAVQVASEGATWGALLVNYFHTTQPGGPDDPDIPWPQPRGSDSESLYLPLIVR